MVDPEAFGEQPVLQGHHVGIGVARELHPLAVAGLRRLAVADAVGQDHVVPGHIEELSGAEQLVGELRLQELGAAASGAMEDQDRVAHHALRVLLGLAQRPVVQPDLGPRLAAPEANITGDPVPFARGEGIDGGRARRSKRQA